MILSAVNKGRLASNVIMWLTLTASFLTSFQLKSVGIPGNDKNISYTYIIPCGHIFMGFSSSIWQIPIDLCGPSEIKSLSRMWGRLYGFVAEATEILTDKRLNEILFDILFLSFILSQTWCPIYLNYFFSTHIIPISVILMWSIIRRECTKYNSACADQLISF